MDITSDGWLVEATVRRGIPDKVYSEPNKGVGLALHSIEGSVAGAYSRFLSEEKDVSGRYTAYAAASTMFINPKEGRLIQMYPVTASTWTSGSRSANTSLWAIESEGKAGEPLNANQVKNMMTLTEVWERHVYPRIRKASRDGGLGAKNIWEHNEVSDSPTACPSGRYEPYYEALRAREDDDMAQLPPEILEYLKYAPARQSALEHALTGKTGTEAIEEYAKLSAIGRAPVFTRVETLEREGDQVARSNINGHIDNHGRQQGEKVAPHKHKPGEVE